MPILYCQKYTAGIKGRIISCKVTAIAAAILFDLNTHATAIESSVFMLQSGVKPKKIPMADPNAIECGLSAIVINVMWCDVSHRFRRTSGAGKRGPSRKILSSTGKISSKQLASLRRQCYQLTQRFSQ